MHDALTGCRRANRANQATCVSFTLSLPENDGAEGIAPKQTYISTFLSIRIPCMEESFILKGCPATRLHWERKAGEHGSMSG